MAQISIRDLKQKYGITQAQIDEARVQQEAQRRAGMPVQSLAVQLEIEPPKRAEARLGEVISYKQGPKTDTNKPAPIHYNFYGGNMSIAFDYIDTITERLFDEAPTTTKAKEALAVLTVICRYLAWQSYECTKTAKEIGQITRTGEAHISRSLALLEKVGAIKRIRKGTSKIITVTPEGAYRGKIVNHPKVVERHKLDVIEGGKSGD